MQSGTRRLPRGQLYTAPLRTARAVLTLRPTDLDHGADCQELAREAATRMGSKRGVALPHARVAFACLLDDLQLKAGSIVLLTPVTLPDMVNVILDAGLIPRWVDLSFRTGQINTVELETKLSRRTKVLLLTHLCGLVPPMGTIMELAARHDVVVFEDTSQAMGARFEGKQLGTFGRAGFFSLTTLKPVSSYLGGLVVTDDVALADRLERRATALPAPQRRGLVRRLVRDTALHAASAPRGYDLLGHELLRIGERLSPALVSKLQRGELPGLPGGGLDARRRHLPTWMWTRYTNLQARLALRSFADFDAGLQQRQRLGAHLLRRLNQATPPAPGRPRPSCTDDGGNAAAWWRFPYWTPDPQGFRARLRQLGVDSAMTNLRANHREPAFRSFQAKADNATGFTTEMVFLPIHPNLTCADMDHVADAVLLVERERSSHNTTSVADEVHP